MTDFPPDGRPLAALDGARPLGTRGLRADGAGQLIQNGEGDTRQRYPGAA